MERSNLETDTMAAVSLSLACSHFAEHVFPSFNKCKSSPRFFVVVALSISLSKTPRIWKKFLWDQKAGNTLTMEFLILQRFDPENYINSLQFSSIWLKNRSYITHCPASPFFGVRLIYTIGLPSCQLANSIVENFLAFIITQPICKIDLLLYFCMSPINSVPTVNSN